MEKLTALVKLFGSSRPNLSQFRDVSDMSVVVVRVLCNLFQQPSRLIQTFIDVGRHVFHARTGKTGCLDKEVD